MNNTNTVRLKIFSKKSVAEKLKQKNGSVSSNIEWWKSLLKIRIRKKKKELRTVLENSDTILNTQMFEL